MASFADRIKQQGIDPWTKREEGDSALESIGKFAADWTAGPIARTAVNLAELGWEAGLPGGGQASAAGNKDPWSDERTWNAEAGRWNDDDKSGAYLNNKSGWDLLDVPMVGAAAKGGRKLWNAGKNMFSKKGAAKTLDKPAGAATKAAGKTDDAAKEAKKGLIRRHPKTTAAAAAAAGGGAYMLNDEMEANAENAANAGPGLTDVQNTDTDTDTDTDSDVGKTLSEKYLDADNLRAAGMSLPDTVRRGGGHGTMPNRSRQSMLAKADTLDRATDLKDRREARQAETARLQDTVRGGQQYGQIADLYDKTGGREAGAWDALDQGAKDQAFRQFNLNQGAAGDKKRKLDGMMQEAQNRWIDGGMQGPQPQAMLGGQDPKAFFDDGTVTNEKFSEATGMDRAGTGLTQNADGSWNSIESKEAFDTAGGLDSAQNYLVGDIQGGAVADEIRNRPDLGGRMEFNDPLLDENNNPLANPDSSRVAQNREQQEFAREFGPGDGPAPGEWERTGGIDNGETIMAGLENTGTGDTFTDQFGQESPLDSVRNTGDMRDYDDATFGNREDALGYINRGEAPATPDMDNPAPEYDNPEPMPEEEDEDFWRLNNPLAWGAGIAGGAALAHPATRNWGKEVLKKGAGKFRGAIDKMTPAKKTMSNAGPVQLHKRSAIPAERSTPLLENGMPSRLTSEQFRRMASGGMNPTQRRVGGELAVQNMSRPGLVSGAGRTRTLDNRHVAGNDDLRKSVQEEMRRRAAVGNIY